MESDDPRCSHYTSLFDATLVLMSRPMCLLAISFAAVFLLFACAARFQGTNGTNRVAVHQKNQEQSLLLLFEQWREEALHRQFFYFMMLKFIGEDRLWEITKSSTMDVVNFRLAFDYNRRTFRSVASPTVVTLASPWVKKDVIDEFRQQLQMSRAEKSSNETCFGILLCVEGTVIKNLFCFSSAIHPESTDLCEQILDRINIRLTSPEFSSWNSHAIKNVQLQVENMPGSLVYDSFVANALHVGSNKSLHLTHVVEITLELGFGLGEIKKLTSFKVVPVADILAFFDKQGSLSEDLKTTFDLVNSSCIAHARKSWKRSDMAMFPVIYRNKPAGLFYVERSFLPIGAHTSTHRKSVASCNRAARKAFQQLQSTKLPQIQSPELH